MGKKVYFIFGITLVTTLLVVFIYGLFFASNPKEIPSALIGKKARPFTATTFDGQKISLDQYLGKPVILNFWASWCVECRREARIIERAHRIFTPKGAVFIGIAINDERKASLAFIRKYGKTYTLAPDDEIGSIALDYGVTAVPETFFIDKEGVIRQKHISAIHIDLISNFLSEELSL